VQVDRMKPKLKPPRSKHLKLRCVVPLSNFAFKFNLRRYSKGIFLFYKLSQISEWRQSGKGLHSSTFQLNLSRFCHPLVSPCLVDWGKTMLPTYPTKCAYVEPRSGRV